jgi:hypothetical protein
MSMPQRWINVLLNSKRNAFCCTQWNFAQPTLAADLLTEFVFIAPSPRLRRNYCICNASDRSATAVGSFHHNNYINRNTIHTKIMYKVSMQVSLIYYVVSVAAFWWNKLTHDYLGNTYFKVTLSLFTWDAISVTNVKATVLMELVSLYTTLQQTR